MRFSSDKGSFLPDLGVGLLGVLLVGLVLILSRSHKSILIFLWFALGAGVGQIWCAVVISAIDGRSNTPCISLMNQVITKEFVPGEEIVFKLLDTSHNAYLTCPEDDAKD